MSKKNYDIIVLGSGVAGGHVAARCSDAGMRVAMVESGGFGGTCPLRGCEPKKVLADAAETMERMNNAYGKGVEGRARIEWETLMRFKRSFTDDLSPKIRRHYEGKGIDTFTSPGRFTAPDTIASGSVQLSAPQICIATGATPRPLDFPGSGLLATSDDFLDLPRMPRRIVFIGAGFIAFELAHIANAAGAETTIVHRSDRVLRKFDRILAERLAAHMQNIGVPIFTNCPPKGMFNEGSGLVLTAGDSRRFKADLIVNAAGRVPALERLDLAAGNVEMRGGGVAVNEFLQSVSNPAVFAAGDVIAESMPLTPVASVEAEVVVRNLIDGVRHTVPTDPTPYSLFTYPPLAAVGLLEEQAREQGREFDIVEGDSAGWSEYQRIGQRCAGFRLLVEKGTGLLLGAHILGDSAEETVNLFALAMRRNVTVDELKNMLWAYPSFGYALKYMFR
jgi:glutathione reductase (NADPH)